MTPRPRLAAVLAIVATCTLYVNRASADMGRGGGFGGAPNVDIRIRFENLEEFADRDFYLKYGLNAGNPYLSMHLTRVYPATTTLLEGKGHRVTEIILLAVPRGQAIPQPVKGDEDNWLHKALPGQIQSDWLTAADHRTLDESENGCSLLYRVHLDGGTLTVTCVEAEAPKALFWILTRPGFAAKLGAMGGAFTVAVLFFTVALIAGGIWLSRRGELRSAVTARRWFLTSLGMGFSAVAISIGFLGFELYRLFAVAAALLTLGLVLMKKGLISAEIQRAKAK